MSNCIVSGSVVSSYGLIQQLQGSQRRGGLTAPLAHVHVGLASPSRCCNPGGAALASTFPGTTASGYRNATETDQAG